VAPTLDELAAKDKAVILLIVTTGTVGAGGSVVKLDAEEYVVPVSFLAAMIREYVLLGLRFVKVAERPVRPESIDGVTN